MMIDTSLVHSHATAGHNYFVEPEKVELAPDVGADPALRNLLARGREKYRAAMADLPAEHRASETYATLGDWLAANPSPRVWARRKARELMQESAEFRDLGMDLREATHWLKELADKWKLRAEAQRVANIEQKGDRDGDL